VLAFFDAGLVDEVRSLRDGDRPLSPVAAQAIGYREVLKMLDGRATLPETIERIQARSRQFAKRQVTWFRSLAELKAFPVDPDEDPESIAGRLARTLE
jgi:tRNA dimethylallyltransferase